MMLVFVEGLGHSVFLSKCVSFVSLSSFQHFLSELFQRGF